MAEVVTPKSPNGEGTNPVTPAANGNGNDPVKNGNEGGNKGLEGFDPSKLSDEQVTKMLEDQRLWKTPRLQELRDKAKKANDYEAAEAQKAQEAQIKKGEFDKVLSEKDAKIKELEAKIESGQVDNTLRAELQKAGIKNIEAGLKLLDRTNLKIGENGKLEGLDEAIGRFKSQYPELLTNSNLSVGSGTNPSNPGSGEPVKMSDVRNPNWYNKPENKEIIKQIQMGKITVIDD